MIRRRPKRSGVFNRFCTFRTCTSVHFIGSKRATSIGLGMTLNGLNMRCSLCSGTSLRKTGRHSGWTKLRSTLRTGNRYFPTGCFSAQKWYAVANARSVVRSFNRVTRADTLSVKSTPVKNAIESSNLSMPCLAWPWSQILFKSTRSCFRTVRLKKIPLGTKLSSI